MIGCMVAGIRWRDPGCREECGGTMGEVRHDCACMEEDETILSRAPERDLRNIRPVLASCSSIFLLPSRVNSNWPFRAGAFASCGPPGSRHCTGTVRPVLASASRGPLAVTTGMLRLSTGEATMAPPLGRDPPP